MTNEIIASLPGRVQKQIKDITDIIVKCVPSPLGVYLHGSICLGGYTDGRSDIDILIISDADMDRARRSAFADEILTVHDRPAHIELSVVKRADTLKSPVTCQFHFSESWADVYAAHDESNYLLGCDFPDGDIPAYMRTARESGITLYGQPPDQLLPIVSDAEFFASVTQDIPTFSFDDYGIFDSNILTLARTLSFAETGRERTKIGGAEWAAKSCPRFAELLGKAIKAYKSNVNGEYDKAELEAYKDFMLDKIKAKMEQQV